MSIFITGASGFVGGTVARRLVKAGYPVRGLIRDRQKADALRAMQIQPVLGELDDYPLLALEASRSDGVINAADSDHTGAIDALLEGLKGSNRPLIHTSGSSVIADDAQGNAVSEQIYDEDTPFVVLPFKQPRRDNELRILDAKDQGVRSIVICPSNIYGTGAGLTQDSFQIPFLVAHARQNGAVRIVGTGVNRWSNVHIDDLAELYLLALRDAPAGAYYFVENGEASFADIGASIAKRLEMGPVQSWSAEEAAPHWGVAHTHFTFGTNSRVRAARARRELGWTPVHTSAQTWIEQEMTA
ncbi:NAD-dependent epimerase/dehydratase family protein [Burkholderia cepacia]|uniref:NAD-dependent epimerase/dehydratase family protein n=1 Tax=Burkholderia cepacia TaxID=292 RepID=UPI00158DA21F|nr:NAD-dependent epimerase/dehydratase family protein [Burkholderia cepacia]